MLVYSYVWYGLLTEIVLNSQLTKNGQQDNLHV